MVQHRGLQWSSDTNWYRPHSLSNGGICNDLP